MTRCLKDREAFALVNHDLADGDRIRLNAHIAGCSACTTKISTLSALRDAAAAALVPAKPDWSAIDAGIERAIRQVKETETTEIAWLPLALTAAAAALVAMALLVPDLHETPLPHSATPATPPAILPEQLKITVVDTIGVARCTPKGTVLHSGAPVGTDDNGGIRLALGPDARLEMGPSSAMNLVSSNVQTPTVSLERGVFLITVLPGALESELIVLAAGASFAIFSGSAEFSIGSDVNPKIRVRSGEVLPISDTDQFTLAVDKWRLPDSSSTIDRQRLLPLIKAPSLTGDPILADKGKLETKLYRPTGTLSKRIVREVMSHTKPKLTNCYETSLERFPSLSTTISVTAHLNVSDKGHVSDVRLKGTEEWPELERCLSRTFRGMVFPPPSGGAIELILPQRLSPAP